MTQRCFTELRQDEWTNSSSDELNNTIQCDILTALPQASAVDSVLEAQWPVAYDQRKLLPLTPSEQKKLYRYEAEIREWMCEYDFYDEPAHRDIFGSPREGLPKLLDELKPQFALSFIESSMKSLYDEFRADVYLSKRALNWFLIQVSTRLEISF